MCLQKVKPVFNNHNKNKNEKPVNGKYKNKRTSEKGFFLIPVIYFVNNCFSKVECCAGSTAHLVDVGKPSSAKSGSGASRNVRCQVDAQTIIRGFDFAVKFQF